MTRQQLMQGLILSAQSYEDSQPRCSGQRVCLVKDPASGVEYAVHRRGSLLTIVFRGTDSPADWRSNFCFARKVIPYDNESTRIRVHEGFLNAYKSPRVRKNILGLVDSSTQKVRITGHSRGAALAVLCGLDIQYHHPDCCLEVLLFGCPRVGNEAFARSYNKRVFTTFNVRCGNDIVTHLPPALLGYRHVGVQVNIGPRRILPSALDHLPRRYCQYLLE